MLDELADLQAVRPPAGPGVLSVAMEGLSRLSLLGVGSNRLRLALEGKRRLFCVAQLTTPVEQADGVGHDRARRELFAIRSSVYSHQVNDRERGSNG